MQEAPPPCNLVCKHPATCLTQLTRRLFERHMMVTRLSDRGSSCEGEGIDILSTAPFELRMRLRLLRYP